MDFSRNLPSKNLDVIYKLLAVECRLSHAFAFFTHHLMALKNHEMDGTVSITSLMGVVARCLSMGHAMSAHILMQRGQK